MQPGCSGVGLQVLLAPPHLEQVQELRLEPLRRRARAERPEIQPRRARQVRRDVAPRKLVRQHDLHVRRHPQLDDVEVGVREQPPRLLVMRDRRFERRPRKPVLDPRHRVPQVQQPRRLFALLEQAQQATPQQPGFGKIRLALARPQHEDRRLIRQPLDRRVERRQIVRDFDAVITRRAPARRHPRPLAPDPRPPFFLLRNRLGIDQSPDLRQEIRQRTSPPGRRACDCERPPARSPARARRPPACTESSATARRGS